MGDHDEMGAITDAHAGSNPVAHRRRKLPLVGVQQAALDRRVLLKDYRQIRRAADDKSLSPTTVLIMSFSARSLVRQPLIVSLAVLTASTVAACGAAPAQQSHLSPRPSSATGATKTATVAAASANGSITPAAQLAKDTYPKASYPGLQHLHYRFGPVHLKPGQDMIKFEPIAPASRPSAPGYITAFRPGLTYVDGKVPPVDVVHLHHGVWIVNGQTRWAGGEEKTNFDLPKGFGWRYTPKENWVMNHMIHNLYPTQAAVYITWDIDFLPDSAPAAAPLKPVQTQWMDVSGPSRYPVFDAMRKAGRKTFTFPDQAAPGARGLGSEHQWVAPSDQTLVWTAGHLHPGGLRADLTITRSGRTIPLFRSQAHYFEPAGPVSWDVALTATKPNWRVKVRKGDIVKVSGTYDVSSDSWPESMAIMFVERYAGTDAGGADPFVTPPDARGLVTHGHLRENDNHGGGKAILPDARTLRDGHPTRSISVVNFFSTQGDLNRGVHTLPTIRHGQRLTFINKDARRDIYHTITACRAPCNGQAGIAYPQENGPRDFDSGELGTGPRGMTASSGHTSWATPARLPVGTYTYYCRVHPFMRGAFRVVR